MTVDTSREAVEDLIADWRDNKGKSGYSGRGDRMANTLAALLDERDAQHPTWDGWHAQQQRIRDLEAGNAQIREHREQWMARALAAEAERDRLAADLAKVTECRDEYGHEIDVVNARWERAEVVRDKITASMREMDEFVAVFRAAWIKADREGRAGERVRSGLKAVSRAILADTNEGKGNEQ